jgi:hypothetical protein
MSQSANSSTQIKPSLVSTTTPISVSFQPRVRVSPRTRGSSLSTLPMAAPIVNIDPHVSPLSDTIAGKSNSLAGSSTSTAGSFAGEDHSIEPAHPRTHHMVTRAQNNIIKPRQLYDGIIQHPIARALLTVQDGALAKPTCFSNAINIPEWRTVMQTKFNALLHNKTWSLISPTTAKNVVGCKWVFKLKRKANDTIERHKARLVAKGYQHQASLDFGEMFSPVVKPTTIRTVLSIAYSAGWVMKQIDIQNVFLHDFV